MRVVRAGTDLFGQGENCDDVYNLHTGWMFTYLILEDGRRQILSFGLCGGLYGLFPEQVATMPYGCQALSDVTVCAVPRKHLLRLIQQKPEMGLQLAWLGKRDEMLLYEHLTSIGRRSARERVAYLLLELFCRAQQRLPQARGEVIGLPLNQAHIADAMGLTSIHVSRTLKALREDGILQLRDGLLEIFDPEGLFEAAVMDVDGASQWIEVSDETLDPSSPRPPAESWLPARMPAAIRSRVPHGGPIGLPSSANANSRAAGSQPYVRR
ncbi:Crp/Fnr family transcriptional regulator [Virgifigura deserti]|uniref:Crp/Fnr family transcriptional regulator n=1 Tax=Virgifigura deserti TaxID=2268457 RepID=UPI003CCB84DC